ncbi:MAG: hypothetical protein KGM99_18405, partial [Burkholderiales bacterium]|nr:hypothetical protein [Burkholderiales bacterium]
WIVAIGLGSAIFWKQVNQNSVRIHAEQGLVFYRGSWAPLIMMLAIFILKYMVNVALHLNPELHRNMQFALTCTFTFGLFNGLFLGKMAHVLVLYRRAFEATSKFPKMENIENAPR